MPRRTRQRRAPAERPAEILAAALACFAEKGFAGTRLDDVAARAGLSKAGIYLYFPDKEALFVAVIEANIGTALDAAAAVIEKGELGAMATIEMMLALVTERIVGSNLPVIFKIIVGESQNFPTVGRIYRERVVERAFALLERVIAGGIARGELRAVDARHTVRSIMGPMLLAMLWRSVLEPLGAEPLDVRAFTQHHAGLMRRALLAPESKP